MKKTIAILTLFLLAIVPGVLGAEPELLNSWTLLEYDLDQVKSGDQLATAVYGVEIWNDERIAFVTPVRELSGNAYRLNLIVYNLAGGFGLWDNTTTISCGGTGTTTTNFANIEPTYIENGLLMFGGAVGCSGSFYGRGTVAVYDVSSSLFTEYDGGSNSYQTTATSPGGGKAIPIWTGSEAFEFVANANYFEYNSTGSIVYEDTLIPGLYPSHDDFMDYQNNVFIDRDDNDNFYKYLDESFDGFNESSFIDQAPAEVIDWNRNPNNPEFLLANKKIMIVGGSAYNNFQTSSYQIPFNALYMFERSNIVGTNGNYWAWADLENLSAPTNETGTNPINADYIWREGNNYIVTYNSTTRNLSVYTVPLPDFFAFLEEGINTAPYHDDLEFLGIDISNRFIFKNTVTDDQGGFVSQAQQVNTIFDDLEELTVTDVIRFDDVNDLNLVTKSGITNSLDLLTSVPSVHAGTGFPSNSLEFEVDQQGILFIELREPFDLKETNQASTSVVWSYDEIGLLNRNERSVNMGYVDPSGKIITEFYVQRFNDNDTAYIYERDGLSDTFLGELNLTGEEDFFRFLHNFDFTTQTVEVIITTNDDLLTTNRPFIDPTAFGFSGVFWGDDMNYFGDYRLIVGTVGIEYELEEPRLPEYELLGQFDEGETQVFATSLTGVNGYGQYVLYSWLTDDTLGEDNYDYLTTLTFIYDNETQTLDQNTINQLIEEAQAEAEDDAFSKPDFIEGDLITDTAFGYLEKWNIKSTASKFLIGLALIIAFIGAGGWVGMQVKSPIVSALGALFGGVGGLFLVTYWGLFPAWVGFTITLIVFVVIASMARNALMGQGGS